MPEGFVLFEAVREGHRELSDQDLVDGVVINSLHRLDGTTKVLTHQMLFYDRFGQHTYVIGPQVRDLFCRTDLTKVTPDMIKPPAHGFYVALPDCPWKLWGGKRTGLHPLKGVYVSFMSAFRKGTNPNQDPRKAKAQSEYGMAFLLWGDTNENSIGPGDDAVLFHNLSFDEWMREGQDLQEFFTNQEVMKELHTVEDWREFRLEVPDGEEAERIMSHQRESLQGILRLVINLCLYLQSEEHDIYLDDPTVKIRNLQDQAKRKKKPGKRKKIERQIDNMSRAKVIYVGPTYEERAVGTRTGGTHESPVEHDVPPHYQHYWVGSQEDRRRVLKYKGMYVRGSGKPDRTVVKFREPLE
jgi:hypothetical protein